MLLPRIEKVIEEHNGTIHLVKVDIDDNAEIAMEYGVSTALFTMIFNTYYFKILKFLKIMFIFDLKSLF